MASGGSKPKKPEFVAPPALITALDKYMEQGSRFPGLQDMTTESARLSIEGKEKLFPGYTGSLGQAWQIAQSRGQGLVDAETAQRVSQMAAQSGFATGAGPGSEQTGLQAAKQYGLTAMGLQDSGIQLGGQLREEANRMMPLQAINQAFNPAAFRDEQIAQTNLTNQQRQSDYEYDMKYGGSKTSGIFGGLLGGGLGALGGGAVSGFNPMAMLSGAGMGAQLGGGIGGSYGGAQGQGMGGIFGGLGQAMQSFGGSMGSMGGSAGSTGGIFGSLAGASQAAPYASSYTRYGGGYVPRATPVQSTQ